jgi:hypothetical protein
MESVVIFQAHKINEEGTECMFCNLKFKDWKDTEGCFNLKRK